MSEHAKRLRVLKVRSSNLLAQTLHRTRQNGGGTRMTDDAEQFEIFERMMKSPAEHLLEEHWKEDLEGETDVREAYLKGVARGLKIGYVKGVEDLEDRYTKFLLDKETRDKEKGAEGE
jgi:hypothetical protein